MRTSPSTAAADSMDALNGELHHAIANLLFRLADDELILGYASAAWTSSVPISEERLPFAAMAKEEVGHALSYYELLHELGHDSPQTLIHARGPRRFRCASLVSRPQESRWAPCLMRQFLYDAAEVVRSAALRACEVTPLAELAAPIHGDEQGHLVHGRKWVIRVALANEGAHEELQAALQEVYPHALGLFEPTEADETLAQGGICPREEELQQQWESAVAPVLAQAGLAVPVTARPVYGGRVGRHPDGFADQLSRIQQAYEGTP